MKQIQADWDQSGRGRQGGTEEAGVEVLVSGVIVTHSVSTEAPLGRFSRQL